MKYLLGVLALALLAYLVHHAADTQRGASKVLRKAGEMRQGTSEEAGEIAFRVVANRYPLSEEAVRARRNLYGMRVLMFRQATPPGEVEVLRDRVLGDPIVVEGDPYVGVLSLVLAAICLHLAGLFGLRSRTRSASLLLLLVTLALGGATQTRWGLRTVEGLSEQIGEFLYSHLPWLAAGSVLVGALLALSPRLRAS